MESFHHLVSSILLLLVSLLIFSVPSASSTTTKRFHFTIEMKQVTRLCYTKSLVTVNGEYPGPTIAVNEGDNVEVKVSNHMAANATIHWHGVRQYRTAWADGPAYITQCPIKGGGSYTYRFKVADQRGTLWWHAHYSWQRASVHGAFIISPRLSYPFPAKIQAEIPIVFGEWWNGDADAIENEMMMYGSGPNSSDAYTINGLPGPLYPSCSPNDTFIQAVEEGKTYLLRIINAALNDELFFAVANHTLKVVEVDAVYTKPFDTPAIMIAPGQTTNVLLTANQVPDSSSTFPMAITPYLTSFFPFDNSTALGFLKYTNPKLTKSKGTPPSITVPNLPDMTDTVFATKFAARIRSLGTSRYPCRVPKTVDKRVRVTISLNLQDCPEGQTCKGYKGKRFLASMNNQSFIRPATSILESHYKNQTTSGLSYSFPEEPRSKFDFTGVDPWAGNLNTEFGTKVLSVPYGTNLEIVLQGTSLLNKENHPIHVHGHNFFIVGTGFGNYDADMDPARYNLVDPPERNTVPVPTGGWSAIRFKADNPGAWFIHCHLEEHTTWGLAMAFVVRDGAGPGQSLLPPPHDLPSC